MVNSRFVESIRNLARRGFLTGLIILPTVQAGQTPISPAKIPQFISPLVIPPVYVPDSSFSDHDSFTISVSQFQQDLGLGAYDSALQSYTGLLDSAHLPVKTTVWGYGGWIKDPATGNRVHFSNFPGPTFEATRGRKFEVRYTNNLIDSATGAPLSHPLAVDPTIHWANPNGMSMMPPFPWPAFPPGFPAAQTPVPLCTHLHGGENAAASDGGPEQWFTPGNAITGPAFNPASFIYLNTQPATTLWYHDHALGITRLNVYMGLAGFYIIRDNADPVAPHLPSGKYEIPLVIQDRSFATDGSLMFPAQGTNDSIHPYWEPEFMGTVIIVNGKAWPYLTVEARRYRFRILDGSNARFYSLHLINQTAGSSNPVFWQIGADGGYLPAPVQLTDSLYIAPGERADVIIDFTGLAGSSVNITNSAFDSYTSKVMQFKVVAASGADTSTPPSSLSLPSIVKLTSSQPLVNVGPGAVPDTLTGTPVRSLILNKVEGPGGPSMELLNNTHYNMPVTETPRVGATEIWRIINTTDETHPIHLHLVQFQLLDRQNFDTAGYLHAWDSLNSGVTPGAGGTYLAVDPYLQNSPVAPPPQEQGWKDTYKAFSGQVMRLIVRFAPQDAASSLPGVNQFPFDPTTGSYVWHCHMIDHEDNDMMRPYALLSDSSAVRRTAPKMAALEASLKVLSSARGTVFSYTLPASSPVKLQLFTLQGKLVATLHSGYQKSGTYSYQMTRGRLSQARYLVELTAATRTITRLF